MASTNDTTCDQPSGRQTVDQQIESQQRHIGSNPNRLRIGIPPHQRFSASNMMAVAIVTMALRDPALAPEVDRIDIFDADIDQYDVLIGCGGTFSEKNYRFDSDGIDGFGLIKDCDNPALRGEIVQRQDGSMYHSAGLAWYALGRRLVRRLLFDHNETKDRAPYKGLTTDNQAILIGKIANYLDDILIKEIDADGALADRLVRDGYSDDNLAVFRQRRDHGLMSVSAAVIASAPPFKDNGEQLSYGTLADMPILLEAQTWNKGFVVVLNFLRQLLGNYTASVAYGQYMKWQLDSIIHNYKKRVHNGILVIPDAEFDWENTLLGTIDDKEVQFVIAEKSTEKSSYWRVTPVQGDVGGSGPRYRTEFPKEWIIASRTSNGPSLSGKLGLPGLVFLNGTGAYAGAKTKDAAIAVAVQALEAAATASARDATVAAMTGDKVSPAITTEVTSVTSERKDSEMNPSNMGHGQRGQNQQSGNSGNSSGGNQPATSAPPPIPANTDQTQTPVANQTENAAPVQTQTSAPMPATTPASQSLAGTQAGQQPAPEAAPIDPATANQQPAGSSNGAPVSAPVGAGTGS